MAVKERRDATVVISHVEQTLKLAMLERARAADRSLSGEVRQALREYVARDATAEGGGA